MKKKTIAVNPFVKSHHGPKEKTLASELLDWLDNTTAKTSMHGCNWFVRIDNVVLKIIFFICIEVVFWSVVASLVMSGFTFVADKSIQSARVSSPGGNISFPQITICHPWYFERQAFLGRKDVWVNLVVPLRQLLFHFSCYRAQDLGVPDNYTDEFATLLSYTFDFGRFTINRPVTNFSQELLNRFHHTKDDLIRTNGFGSVHALIKNVTVQWVLNYESSYTRSKKTRFFLFSILLF